MAKFVKGQSGNPSGRPKGSRTFRETAEAFSEMALETLVQCLADEDGKTRIAAANSILDRALGKPSQAITGEDGKALEVRITGDDARAELAGLLASVAARASSDGDPLPS